MLRDFFLIEIAVQFGKSAIFFRLWNNTKTPIMKLLYTLTFTILYSIPIVYSQSIVRSTVGVGGSSQTVTSKNKTYFVSQSIGQASVIGTSTKNGYTIRQGFQQPPHIFIVGALNELSDLKATIFPNPFQQSVYISFKDLIENDVSVIMHDISGRLILKETFTASQLITLPLANIASGDYILNIISDNKHLTTSIIKQ
ncbi:MAG: T9SS type A sorting domain-containing protein [Cyclobacteriaceae bacterium]|nr:T9SS type A sorting domain-containing protein [Cyclobacteriaceae bacterium]